MKRLTRMVVALAVGLSSVGGVWAADAVHKTEAVHKPHWRYEGKEGPDQWGNLDPGFEMCKLGRQQSPINIETETTKKELLPALNTAYLSMPMALLDNGHTLQVVAQTGSRLILGSEIYNLLQVHFHIPSEEQVNGKSYPMVAHFVHKNAAGALAVVAVLFEEGASNPVIEQIWKSWPKKVGKERLVAGVSIDLSKLLPKKMSYYAFEGSLTTPPCSEKVQWLVVKSPVSVSAAQLQVFAKHYPMNARAVQPLNGRVVKESQ